MSHLIPGNVTGAPRVAGRMNTDPEDPRPAGWPPHMPMAFEAWTHEGLQCVLTPTPDIMVPKGPHNGYVRVPPGHPAAGKDYGAAEALFDLDVSGGLTYAYQCPDGGTWFGWDDMHSWLCSRPARDETNDLAEQLAVCTLGRLHA